jgi:hypothetical protein
MPSPLISATLTLRGDPPAGWATAGLKVPSPLPSKTLTELLPQWHTTRWKMPSPLKSAPPTLTQLMPRR